MRRKTIIVLAIISTSRRFSPIKSTKPMKARIASPSNWLIPPERTCRI